MAVISSGPIIRNYKMLKALGLVVGVHLSNTGELSQNMPKSVNSLKKWY